VTDIKRVSHWLSRHLRHKSNILVPNEGGWVPIGNLVLAAPNWVTMAKVVEAVETSDKQRFAIEDEMIRANQGHTIPVDLGLGLVPVVPPEFLFHGTYHEAVDAIEQEGLSKMKRHHVHLAVETGTAVQVGRRSGTPVVFKVASGQMHRDGYPFYCSVNGVWLVEEVPHEYLERLCES
jgi:putative RNA 2'-phosphotransferase